MAISPYLSKNVSKEMLESAEFISPPENYLLAAFRDSQEFLEECLLAVLAAGIPVSCIRITPPHEHQTVEWGSFEVKCGFEFVGSIN